VTLLVLGIVFIVSPAVKLTRRPFMRDAIFYLLCVTGFFGIVADGKIYLWESGLFVSAYIVYVIGVFLARYTSQRLKRKHREALGIIEDSGEDLFEVREENEDSMALLDDSLLPRRHNERWGGRPVWGTTKTTVYRPAINEDDDGSFGEFPDGERYEHNRSFSMILKEFLFGIFSSIGWAELRTRDKVILAILFPITILRSLSVPCAGPEGQWSRPLAVISPVTVPMLVFLSFKNYSASVYFSTTPFPVWAVIILVGALFSAAAYITTNNREPPRYIMVFVVLGFIGSTVWMYLFATEIIALVRTFGRIMNLTESIMGLTVVAWATSIVDIVSNFLVSRQGHTDMAVGACFGAPTFALLLGTGLSVSYKNILTFPVPFDLNFSGHVWVGFAILIFGIVSTLLFIPLNGFKTSRKYGIYLLVLYGIFGMLSVLLEIGLAIPFLP